MPFQLLLARGERGETARFAWLELAVAEVRGVAPLLPTIVGGAFVDATPGLDERLGVEACGSDAEALVSRVRALLQC